MERLTRRNKQGIASAALTSKIPKEKQKIEGSGEVLEVIVNIIRKLAEYEDTGLTPNQIYELAKANYKHREIIEELEEDCDYWKREALKWANEIGEQKIGPLLWMDEERGK